MKRTALLLSVAVGIASATAFAQSSEHFKRVLLISIDGMHAVDFQNCANGMSTVANGAPYCPALAALGKAGVNYVAASTSKPSDSFPGLISIVTGGSPALTGIYYDVAYSRNFDAPAQTTGNGLAAGPCTAGAAPTGTTTEYEEGIDIDQTKLNGGAPGASLTDGGLDSIDYARLVRDPANGCKPVYPWDFVRVNSIFSVIKQNGGYTAWSDKHPAYSAVASGLGPQALDDFYSPEINSNVVALPGVETPTGMSCATIPDTGADLTAWTNSFKNIQCYDTLKANAIVNEIEGKNHLGTKTTRVPTIFGMNFQAVSVGQKLVEKSITTNGGYLDAAGTPTESLLGEIKFVDAAIGEFVSTLKSRGLYDSTLIVITANMVNRRSTRAAMFRSSSVDRHRLLCSPRPATFLTRSPPPIPGELGRPKTTSRWYGSKSSSDTDASVKILEDNATLIGLGQIYYGPSLSLNYNDPTVDPRTPDIIVTPNVGVTYSGSTSKLAEHGGFAHDDTNVMLLVSNPSLNPETVRTSVGTAQVAPTILKALGMSPTALKAVRSEGTPVLPQINF